MGKPVNLSEKGLEEPLLKLGGFQFCLMDWVCTWGLCSLFRSKLKIGYFPKVAVHFLDQNNIAYCISIVAASPEKLPSSTPSEEKVARDTPTDKEEPM